MKAKIKKVEEPKYSDTQYTFDLTYSNGKVMTARTVADNQEEAEILIRKMYPDVITAKLLGWSQRKLININK